jgi:subtilase family serine protease
MAFAITRESYLNVTLRLYRSTLITMNAVSSGGIMNQRIKALHAACRWLSILVVVTMSFTFLSASTPGGKIVANNTPGYVATAENLGAENPAKVIEVSVWLELHNRSQFDELTQSLYDRNSPNYHHWLKPKDIAARFAPTAQEESTVRQFLAAHNLKVEKTGPNNFYVRARGTVGQVQSAFRIQLNNYQINGKTIRANASDPYIEGPAADLVRAVSGLDDGEFEHPAMARPSLTSSKPGLAAVRASAASTADLFSSQCFTGTEKETFSTNADGELPFGTYQGNKLNLQSLTSNGCAYTPPVIQTAYNLTGLYKEGYDGKGQTIAIVDWCGSSTIQSDANAFSAQFGLPPLTSSNFAITYTAPSLCIAPDQTEINIDVEWAHAVAPGANINLVVPPSANFQDVDEAEFDVVNYGLGTVLSGSFASPELYTAATELENENIISEIGAAVGISMNFASGDDGSYVLDFFRQTVSAPADSPWSTAVGGVTLALNSDNSIAWQSGWGNQEGVLTEEGVVADPPGSRFIGGSGGGASECVTKNTRFRPPICTGGFLKPSYQAGLRGKYRQLPDVSWLADPFTGAAILITVPGNFPEQVWQVWGGTSLATPMFSALWAIANQEALAGGGAPLGQAAPYMYSMPEGTITDVVPVTSKTDVTATIVDSNGTTRYPEVALAERPGVKFVSALWDYPSLEDTLAVLTFGTDLSLKTAPGWDDVTGVGVPNAQAFADSFYGK